MFNKKIKPTPTKHSTQKLKKKGGLNSLKFQIKYGLFNKKISPDEFKLAEEYIISKVDVYTMEKDLLLRGLQYKAASRVIDAYEHLMWLTDIPRPEPNSINNLKGGILDGIR